MTWVAKSGSGVSVMELLVFWLSYMLILVVTQDALVVLP